MAPCLIKEWEVSNGVHSCKYDDVIKWWHFPRYWPFVWGIHRWPVKSPLKGQWRGALMFPLICAWTNSWVNNRDAGDLRHHRAHYNVTIMKHDLKCWLGADTRFLRYGDVKWPSWRIELPVYRVFVQQCVQTNNKETSKAHVTVPLWGNLPVIASQITGNSTVY